MARKKKIKLIALSYKIGKKTISVTSEQLEEDSIKGDTRAIENANSLTPKNLNNDFACFNGILHIKVCIGGSCSWVSTEERC